MPTVDFSRNVVCIMGLPFDAVSMDEAVERVRAAALTRTPMFISTPNLNFVVAARTDEAFRDSVARSQLCLVDGMPVVWVSRLLGLPVRERVSGADLFEALANAAGPALKVFFIGGAEGVAQAACEQVNRRQGGLQCVGFESPGFLSVDAMSSDECIARINRAGPDFVIVSLGAKNGQAWIDRNRARLSAPVISYLGAVVNFAAGNLRRAPAWLRRLGLEWLWRIKEEPALWKRYAIDATALARMLGGGVIPLWWQRVLARPGHGANVAVEINLRDSLVVLKLAGAIGDPDQDMLRSALSRAAAAMAQRVHIDLSSVERIDARAIGALLLLRGHQQDIGGSLALCGASKALERQFRYHCVGYLLVPEAPID